MARFRRRMRRARASFHRAYRRASHKGGISPMQIALAGALYGAARPYVASMLPNFFSFGAVDSDNVIIGAAGLYGMTRTSGFTRALGAIALGSEAGIVASKFATGGMTASVGTTANNGTF